MKHERKISGDQGVVEAEVAPEEGMGAEEIATATVETVIGGNSKQNKLSPSR
jgi:hypothetical protein